MVIIKKAALLIVCLSWLSSSAFAAWYQDTANPSSAWRARQMITIHGSSVEATLTNFPVAVVITDTANAVFSKARADGRDILFTSSNQVTKLNHDLEYYQGTTTPSMCAWVNIPTLAATSDTIIYMYYGCGNAATQENKTATWNSNYLAVYHLKENPSTHTAGFFKDSTTNANNASADAVMVSSQETAGLLDGSINFFGNSQIAAPNSTSLSPTTMVMVSAWIQPLNSTGYIRFAAKSFTSDVAPYTVYGIMFDNTQHGRLEIATGATQNACNGVTVIATGTAWSYVVGSYDGANMRLYLNGSLDASAALTGAITTDTQVFSIGGSGYSLAADYFIGRIDEVHVLNTVELSSWVKTEYKNQYNPRGFYALSAEQERPSVMVIGDGLKDRAGPLSMNYAEDKHKLADACVRQKQ